MLMGDPDLRDQLGRAGEIRAKREFTRDEYVRNLTNLCEKVLKE
jgi:hypothetical protein